MSINTKTNSTNLEQYIRTGKSSYQLKYTAIALSSLLALLTSCSTLASLQMQKKSLDNGNIVYVNFNVSPTESWECKTLGQTQKYNWADLKTKGQFTSLQGGKGLLMDNALEYANKEKLDINYIDLQIPDESTSAVSSGSFTLGMDNNPDANATASFYKCKNINPDNTIGYTKSTSDTITIGK